MEKIQERHRSFKIEKIGDQLADIYRDASTKIHHFQVHDKIDVSSLNDKDAKLMKSVCNEHRNFDGFSFVIPMYSTVEL